MKIKQHIPAFMDIGEPEIAEFNTVEELLELEFVKRVKKIPQFHQYSLSQYPHEKPFGRLMSEYDEGRSWFVLGYIYDCSELQNSLPEWKPKEK